MTSRPEDTAWFALAYGDLYEQRWPRRAEGATATPFPLGVVRALRSHR